VVRIKNIINEIGGSNAQLPEWIKNENYQDNKETFRRQSARCAFRLEECKINCL
jgi:hypothetical protein